jgi:hypothetical protein
MNGIALVLLDIWDGDEIQAYQYLEAIVHGILPTLFDLPEPSQPRDKTREKEEDEDDGVVVVVGNHERASSVRQQHADHALHSMPRQLPPPPPPCLPRDVNPLVRTGQHLEHMMRMYLPTITTLFDHVGLPVFLLAYKWFPTLFSDVSLHANKHTRFNHLHYVTLLTAWDICFLMGIDGMYCVAMALFAAAQGPLQALPSPATAEDVSHVLIHVLVRLSPQDLILHVCEVIETCNHPILLQMRDMHHRNIHREFVSSTVSSI